MMTRRTAMQPVLYIELMMTDSFRCAVTRAGPNRDTSPPAARIPAPCCQRATPLSRIPTTIYALLFTNMLRPTAEPLPASVLDAAFVAAPSTGRTQVNTTCSHSLPRLPPGRNHTYHLALTVLRILNPNHIAMMLNDGGGTKLSVACLGACR